MEDEVQGVEIRKAPDRIGHEDRGRESRETGF